MADPGTRGKILPVVPLFHVNAWGLPYLAPLAGTHLVFPGGALDGASLFDLMDQEQVDSAWGVPTVWLGLLAEMDKRGRKSAGFRHVTIGGSAPPASMIQAFEKTYDVDVTQGWGMTEMSPVGSLGLLEPHMQERSEDAQMAMKARQGRRMYGVDLKIVDDAGDRLPHDGKAVGELLVRGNAIAAGYFNDQQASADAIDREGWFRTGDVASIDAEGFMTLVDRSKDLVKSGGDGWLFGEPRQLVCHFKADTSSADPERVQSSPINGFGLALRGDRSSIRLTSPVP